MVTWAVKNSNANDRLLRGPNSWVISVVSTSALVVIGQCNSFDVVENDNCVSAKQNRGGNLEGGSLRWQGWWKDPWQLMSHEIQRRHAGTQETLLNKTNKGNYRFELWELICFFVFFCVPTWRFCTTWLISCKQSIYFTEFCFLVLSFVYIGWQGL